MYLGSAHNHVLQGVLGEPAVQEHGDEQISEGWQAHLERGWGENAGVSDG